MGKRMIAMTLCAAMALGLFAIPVGAANNGSISSLVDSYTAASGSFTLTDASRFYIICDGTPANKLLETVQLAASNFAAAGKPRTLALELVCGSASGVRAGDIVVKQISGLAEEAYRIEVTSSNVTVSYCPGASSSYYGGASYNGLHYGLQEVLKMLMVNGGNTLDCCTIHDAPDTRERAISLDMARKYWSVTWVENLIREASWMGYNAIQLHLTEDQGIRANIWRDGAGNVVPDANGNDFGWAVGANAVSWNTNYRDGNSAYNRDELAEIVRIAKRYHMEVIPSVDFPTHADALIAKFSANFTNAGKNFSFQYNGSTFSDRPYLGAYNNATLNITNDYARNLCFAFVDGYARFFGDFGCTKFCICGDEVSGASSAWATASYTRSNGGSSAKDAYVIFMNEWASRLKSRGYRVRAYNDCLFGTGFYVDGRRSTGAANVAVSQDIDALFWTAETSHTAPASIAAGRTVYNCINFYTYYVLRVSGSGLDARDDANTWWTFNHASAQRIYSGCGGSCAYGSACPGCGWNPSRFYGCSSNTYRQTVTNNLGGGYFLIWGDWAGYDTETNVWTRNDGYNLIDRMWSSAVKMWDWDADSHLSYSSFASNYVAKLRHFPGYRSPSAAPSVPGCGTPVPSAVYTISCSGNPEFRLTAAGTAAGANVQIGAADDSRQQRWVLMADSNGYYSITNLASGLALDVSGARSANGTNVQLWGANSSNAQKWSLQDNGNGTYTLISGCGDAALDLSNGETTEGRNVQIWSWANVPAQKWILKIEPVLEDGLYAIGNAANAAYGLDISEVSKNNGANVHIWAYNGSGNQQFQLTHEENGCYTITALFSGKVLDAANGGCTNGTNIQQYQANNTLAQKWTVLPHADGTYSFVSLKSGKLLDMSGGGAPANGTNVHLWQPNYGTAQRWVLTKIHTHTYTTTVTPPTCTEDGSQVQSCPCGVSTVTVLPATGHTVVTEPAVAPTCTQEGKTEGRHCSVCQAVLVQQQILPAAHTLVTEPAVAATCTEAGRTESSRCSACGLVLKQAQTIPATGHRFVTDPAVAPTCAAEGRTEGSHCSACGMIQQKQETVSKLEHTVVIDRAVEPTYTATGLTEGSHCSVCGTVIVPQKTVAMLKPALDYGNLPSGVYTIKSAGGNFGLDVNGGSTASGANVHLWTCHTGNSQKWIVRSLGNGFYSIENLNSRLALDVSGASSADGANIQQWTANTSAAQQWRFVSNGDGTCSILSACGGKALDVSGAAFANGQNIHLWSRHNGLNQKWELTPVPVLQDGTYTIGNSANTGFVLNVVNGSSANGTNVALAAANNTAAQKFVIRSDGNGFYTIRVAANGKALDVNGAGKTNGTNIQIHDYNGTDAQKWMAIPNSNGSISFFSKCNNLVLDVSGGVLKDGTNIQCWTYNGSSAQQWKLASTSIGLEGVYSIAPSGSTAHNIALANNSTAQSASVVLGSDRQYFVIESFQGGDYGIRSLNSGRYLNASGNGTADGTNVIQYGTANTPAANERWAILPNFDGTYSFVNRFNGLYLDLADGQTTDGTNIQLWSGNNTARQKWKLSTPVASIPNGTYCLVCAGSANYGLDIDASGSNAHLWTRNGGDNQRFTFTYLGNGYYKILARHSGKVLDVSGGVAANGVNVQQYAYNGSDAQQWAAVPNRDGSFTFYSKLNGFALDVNGGRFANGVNVQIWTANGTAAQHWTLN